MIIAISGLHGTGKSTIGKLIAKTLKIRYYSTGEAFRELAKQNNMTIKEFTQYTENHPNIDLELDKKVIEFAKQGNIIIDSQLSGFLLKDIADFKIHLICPLNVRVERMANRDQMSHEEKIIETRLREESELERFNRLYNINLSDEETINKTFDLIIDTENLTIQEIIDLILSKLKE